MTGFYTPPPGSIPTLPVPSLEGVRSAHLIGIGGKGMRNLARLLQDYGMDVTGSDIKDSSWLDEMRAQGMRIWIGHDASRLGSPDVVITTGALRGENPEISEARRRGIPVWARQQAIAAYAQQRWGLAVAGSHGKTTTTSMLAAVLERAGRDPSYLIGGDLNETGSGARSGRGEDFLFEADESDGSFLLARPDIAVVTNVDLDHIDFYTGGQDEFRRAFADFMSGAGTVVAYGDDPGVQAAVAMAGIEAITYGTEPGNDLMVTVSSLGADGARGTVALPGGVTVDLVLRVDGAHNLLNAAAAAGVAQLLGIAPGVVAEGLTSFEGVRRRFEFRGRAEGVDVYDDHGHNPVEMEVTLQTARRRRPERLVALMQPSRHLRVQAFWREMGACLIEADVIWVTDVFGGEQGPIPGVTGQLVVDGVLEADPGANVTYLPHRRDVIAALDQELRPGDLLVTMGSGDVWTYCDVVLDRRGGGDT